MFVFWQSMVRQSLLDLKERLGQVRREKDALDRSLFMFDKENPAQ